VVRDFRRTTSELSSEFSRTLSLEVEERRSTPAPQPAAEAYVAPPVPETLMTTEAAVEPAPQMTIHTPEPVAVVPESRRRTVDADLAPPY